MLNLTSQSVVSAFNFFRDINENEGLDDIECPEEIEYAEHIDENPHEQARRPDDKSSLAKPLHLISVKLLNSNIVGFEDGVETAGVVHNNPTADPENEGEDVNDLLNFLDSVLIVLNYHETYCVESSDGQPAVTPVVDHEDHDSDLPQVG